MITVTGILLDPMQVVLPAATIRFTALSTTGETLTGMEATHVTGEDGSYNFDVEFGIYILEINYTDEYHVSGVVLVDETTPTTLTLQDLIKYTKPVPTEISTLIPNDWEALFNLTISEDEWNRAHEEQVAFGGTLSNEKKSIYKGGNKQLATETITVATGDSEHILQELSYHDDDGNLAVTSTEERNTTEVQSTSTQGSYQGTNGERTAKVTSTLANPKGSVSSSDALTTENVELNKTSQHESSSHTQNILLEPKGLNGQGATSPGAHTLKEENLLAGEGVHQGEVYSKEEVTYLDVDDLVDALLERGVKLKYTRGADPLEGFQRLTADVDDGVKLVTQADKTTLQGRDGVRLVECDTEENTVNIYGKLTVQNPEDFRGDDGATLSWLFAYSNDKGITDPWHEIYSLAHGDIWRRDTQVLITPTGSPTPTGVVEYVKLTAEDGADGDIYYIQSQYTTNEEFDSGIWYDDYKAGDDWRRQRIVQNGNEFGPWLEAERIKGDNGRDGWVPEFEVFYGADATADFDPVNPDLAFWHKNLVNEDYYKYERTIWWYSTEIFNANRNVDNGIDWDKVVEDTYVLTPWTGPTKIKPIPGVDYGDKTAAIFLYVRASENPTDATVGDWSYDFETKTATNISGNTANWSAQLPAEGPEPLWVASGTAFSKTNIDPSIDNWDVDLMSTNGLKYSVAYLYQMTTGDVTELDLPTTSLSFDFSKQKIVSVPDNGWVATRPSNTVEGSKVWGTVAPVTAGAEVIIEPVAANDWETAVVLAINGTSIKGHPGKFGQGTFVKESATVPDDAGKAADILAITGRVVEEGDLINYFWNVPGSEYSNYYHYQDGEWGEINSIILGDQVVENTLFANALRSDDVFTKVLHIGSDSTKRDELTLSGVGTPGNPEARLWAGGTGYADAPFKVDKDGNMVANNVDLTGKINAESGGITGTLTMGTTGNIQGGKTSYADDTPGFFLGYSGDAYKFSLGNGLSWLRWDGNGLTIKGEFAVGSYVASEELLLDAPTNRSTSDFTNFTVVKRLGLKTTGTVRLKYYIGFSGGAPQSGGGYGEVRILLDGVLYRSHLVGVGPVGGPQNEIGAHGIDIDLGTYTSEISISILAGTQGTSSPDEVLYPSGIGVVSVREVQVLASKQIDESVILD